MKILFVTGSLNQGGAEFQLLQMAKLFKQNDHKVSIVAITDYDFYKWFVEENELEYSCLSNDQSKIKRIWFLSKRIRKEKPELIISYLKVPSQAAVFAKLISRSQAKLIANERTAFIQPTYDKIHFNLMRFCAFIVFNSKSRLKYVQERFSFLKHKIGFLPNVVEFEKYRSLVKAYDGVLKIGCIGRISKEKNVANVVRAIKILDENKIDVKLLIFGDARDSEYEEMLLKFIQANDLGNIVQFKGKFSDSEAIYDSVDIVCSVSDYEGFSNVISEALCYGLPVVSSQIPENQYLIEDKVNGFIVDQKDPNSIASGILSYYHLSDSEKRVMSQKNREKAESIFDQESLYRDYLKIISSL